MFVKPATGMRILHPRTYQPIPETGIEVRGDDPDLSYWVRRVGDKDVVEIAPPPAGGEVAVMPAVKASKKAEG